MAEDTVRLMDYLKLDSAYVVGWSDGDLGATRAAGNGTPLERLQDAGGWSSPSPAQLSPDAAAVRRGGDGGE